MVRYASRFNPLAAALAVLAATLLLGAFGPALAGPASLLSWELFGLAITGGTGFLAWHLAQLTALPPGSRIGAALPAALLPLVVLPQIGAAALLVPAALSLALLPRERFAAPLALTGLLAALCIGLIPQLVAAVTMLAAAWLCRARCPAANDNPSLERLPRLRSRFWSVPASLRYARGIPRVSGSRIGE